ncbi:MAG TPA: MBL fold metallo-hydrolase [Candidatus Methanoperedens sp.]|nr:MBL fold metallo-hydrolase [Candidatus Methanoperedens sp.]
MARDTAKSESAAPQRLTFLGAAQNVTGSRYLLETGGTRVLVDCGLYQEHDLLSRNWDPFPVPPASIDTVLLTHAHVDHCGYLPRLVRDGFRGRVVATAVTAEVAGIVLADSAKLQVEDAAFKKRRHARERRTGPHPEVPLYTPEDVETTLPLFEPAAYGATVALGNGLTAEFRDAGHILGSSSVLVGVGAGAARRLLLFSGDVGRRDKPLLNDPVPAPDADWIVVESTYGDRLHEKGRSIKERLATVVTETRRRGGNIVVPSFALERTQELLWYLSELLAENRIPHLLVFVDSPMAVRVTDVFERHPEILDAPMREQLANGTSPFRFPGLKLIRTVEESKAINHISGTVMIIAGSGMCTGGRIKHHLEANIGRSQSTVLFVGYQAVGTLGRQILDGRPEVRLFGKMLPVRARVENIPGFSAHADRDELTRWLSGIRRAPRRLFVTHGEPEAAAAFAQHVREHFGWEASVPAYGETVLID